MRGPPLPFAILLFALPLTLPLAACGSAQSSPATPVSPYAATAVGRIDSAGEARQLVAAADGVIDQLLVKRGDAVAAGQALLKIDCGPRLAEIKARAALSQKVAAAAHTVRSGARPQEIDIADAQIDAAQSALREQEERLAMAEKLIGAGFISKRDLAARNNGRDGAQAELRSRIEQRSLLQAGSRGSEIAEANAAARAAAADTAVAQSFAAQCTLKSPIAGRVLQVLRRTGEFSGASQGTPLIIVGDLSQLIVRAEITERDAAIVHAGQVATVWVDGKPGKWKGRVTELAGVMGRRTARSLDPTDRFDRDVREVFIAFDSAPPPALIGLRVTVGLAK
jgi:multidrug resistance efflux pump